ncbi:MAG TPA: hypothetical protein VKT80_06485, partial [Chloroflexota bacterium]|nr:hypothetical protein [Chloroflexota bacterium]
MTKIEYLSIGTSRSPQRLGGFMLRPTPGRLIYLLIGLVVGIVVLFAYTMIVGLPSGISFLRPS